MLRAVRILSVLLLGIGSIPAVPRRARGAEKPIYPAIGGIERADPRFDKLIPRDAMLEKLAEGLKWSEGPVWDPDGRHVLFSDIPNNRVMKWKEGVGLGVFLKPAGYTGSDPRAGESGSNGLLLDAQGRLVLCQHGDRRVARLEKDGRFTTLCDRYQGKRLNSPNDAVYKSNGDLYFTDPPYGLAKGQDDPARELDYCGVYRLSPDGTATLLTDKMTRPNGIAFSPDEKILYVAQSDPEKAVWMAFDVKPDGTIAKGRVFFDAAAWVKKKLPGMPDGMKVDREGNLFCTGPGGVNVFSPDGAFLGRINTGQPTANCCFGDDGSTLYITANMYLCRIRTGTKGMAPRPVVMVDRVSVEIDRAKAAALGVSIRSAAEAIEKAKAAGKSLPEVTVESANGARVRLTDIAEIKVIGEPTRGE